MRSRKGGVSQGGLATILLLGCTAGLIVVVVVVGGGGGGGGRVSARAFCLAPFDLDPYHTRRGA